MSVTSRHGVGERAGAIGPAWHAGSGHPRNWLGHHRNHRGHRCPITVGIGHSKRGPTYGTGFLGSEGGFRGFRSRARERYTTLLPPSGASRVRLGHAIAVAAIVLEPLLDQALSTGSTPTFTHSDLTTNHRLATVHVQRSSAGSGAFEMALEIWIPRGGDGANSRIRAASFTPDVDPLQSLTIPDGFSGRFRHVSGVAVRILAD